MKQFSATKKGFFNLLAALFQHEISNETSHQTLRNTNTVTLKKETSGCVSYTEQQSTDD